MYTFHLNPSKMDNEVNFLEGGPAEQSNPNTIENYLQTIFHWEFAPYKIS